MSRLEGHDKPCYYCDEKCNSLAGNPSLWPIPLFHGDEPGVVKWHHIGCVSKRLIENASLKDLEAEIKRRKNLDPNEPMLYEDIMALSKAKGEHDPLVQCEVHNVEIRHSTLSAMAILALSEGIDTGPEDECILLKYEQVMSNIWHKQK